MDLDCLSLDEINTIKNMIEWCKYDIEYFKMFNSPDERRKLEILRVKIMSKSIVGEIEKERLR